MFKMALEACSGHWEVPPLHPLHKASQLPLKAPILPHRHGPHEPAIWEGISFPCQSVPSVHQPTPCCFALCSRIKSAFPPSSHLRFSTLSPNTTHIIRTSPLRPAQLYHSIHLEEGLPCTRLTGSSSRYLRALISYSSNVSCSPEVNLTQPI